MAAKDDFGSVVDEILDGRNGGSDSSVIGDVEIIIQRHVEIDPD